MKYTLRGVAIVISLLLIIYVIAYAYVSANKKTIITKVTRQISEKLNGIVSIGNVDLSFVRTFPQISVLLEDVLIKDTAYSRHKHPFLSAEKLYARISIFRVIAKQDPLTGLQVENGNLYIFTDTTGYTNGYLLNPKQPPQAEKPATSQDLVLKDIKLLNFNITMDDKVRGKLVDLNIKRLVTYLNNKDSMLRLRTQSNILVKSLTFNPVKGSYLKGKRFTGNYDLFFDQRHDQLAFNNIDINLDKGEYKLSGKFWLKNNRFFLGVIANELNYNEAKTLLPARVSLALSKVALGGPIDVKASIDGPLQGGNPLVNVKWTSVSSNTIGAAGVSFENCTFTGGYTNEYVPGLPRLDPNSRIYIHNFKGTWEGIPLRSDKIYIDNLAVPMINLDLKSDFSLQTLNSLLENNSLKMESGNASVNITYSGPLTKNSNANTSINGALRVTNGQLLYAPRNITLKDCNGEVVFNKTDVSVKNLRSNVQGNSIIMNGSVKNVLSLMKTNPGKISLDWNVYSPALNLGTFTSLLQKRNKVINPNAGKGKLSKTAGQIDAMLEQSNVSLTLNADKLTFQKFAASNVKASIDLLENSWNLNNISLQSGGGTMQIKGYLKEKNDLLQELKLNANVTSADVNKVMYAFNNFGQDGITYQNLSGKLTSNVDIMMDIDRNLVQPPSNMNGTVDFSLKDGALINYDPIKKLQNLLFKNRNFDDIRFAELKDRFDIKGKDIVINRMEIQSTVMTLFVEGLYSMQPDKTDISIQVPLSNIRKRDDDSKLENKGPNAKGGASVYVRGRPGEDGNIKFKLDVFKKLRGDKKDDKNKPTDSGSRSGNGQ